MAAGQTPLPGMVGGNGSGAIYRDGKTLVIHKSAILPDICIKSNEPTTSRLKRKLSWHHPAIYLVILLNLLIYAIVAMAVRKTAELHVPLAPRFIAKRKRNMLIAWGLVLLGVVLFIAGIVVVDTPGGGGPLGGLMLIAFPILLLTGSLFGIYGCRVVTPSRIDDHYVWLKGCSPEFLAMFPQAP